MQLTSQCPDEVMLAALADGSLRNVERDAVIGHVADCDRCLSSIGMLASLARDPTATDVPTALIAKARALQPRPLAWRTPAVAAAVLVLASMALIYQAAPRSPSPPSAGVATVSNERGPQIEDRLTIIRPRNNDVLRSVVEWQPVAGATGYQLTITREDGSLVWQSRSDATAITIKPPLAPRQSYFLIVKALLPGGRTVASKAIRISSAHE